MHYAYTRPTTLSTRDGRIHPLNTHGWIVFLNAHEQFVLHFLMVFGGGLFITAVVIDLVKKPFRPR
jgi:hypothetical protein